MIRFKYFILLFFLIGGLFFAENAKASQWFDSFDDYTDGQVLNMDPYLNTSTAEVSSLKSWAGGQSALGWNNGINLTYQTAVDENLQDVSVYTLQKSLTYGGHSIYLTFGTSSNIMIHYNYSGSGKIGYSVYDVGNNITTFNNDVGTVLADTWYNSRFQLINNRWILKVDGVTIYTHTAEIPKIKDFIFVPVGGGSKATVASHQYLDNLYLSTVYTNNENVTVLERYDFTLSESEPDFGTVANQACFIGTECRLYFSFNSLAVGYLMYLFNYEDSNFPGNEISSTTVSATPLWQDYVIVPDQATSTILKYNLLLDADEYGWIVKTGITIRWWDEDEWLAYIDEMGPKIDEYCAEENVCANVATTSDFFYGVQCGFQKGACWLLVPNTTSKDFFLETVTKFENSFPFNLYFTSINQAKSSLQKEASSTASFDFPMYSTSTGAVSWQPLINSNTVPDVWSGDSYDLVVNIFTWAWWLLVVFAITFLVYKKLA